MNIVDMDTVVFQIKLHAALETIEILSTFAPRALLNYNNVLNNMAIQNKIILMWKPGYEKCKGNKISDGIYAKGGVEETVTRSIPFKLF